LKADDDEIAQLLRKHGGKMGEELKVEGKLNKLWYIQ
jgi:hypothetical protein